MGVERTAPQEYFNDFNPEAFAAKFLKNMETETPAAEQSTPSENKDED